MGTVIFCSIMLIIYSHIERFLELQELIELRTFRQYLKLTRTKSLIFIQIITVITVLLISQPTK